jgi:hypothetical protein
MINIYIFFFLFKRVRVLLQTVSFLTFINLSLSISPCFEIKFLLFFLFNQALNHTLQTVPAQTFPCSNSPLLNSPAKRFFSLLKQQNDFG